MKVNAGKILNPYSLSMAFRAYVYDAVILAWETGRADIISSTYSKKTLGSECGLYVLKLNKLGDVQLRDEGTWSKDEFLIFHRKEGRGYECLFKSLRDTFAHGHYSSSKRGWITIRHRYKYSGNEAEKTRAFGNMRINTLKKLVAFLDKATSGEI